MRANVTRSANARQGAAGVRSRPQGQFSEVEAGRNQRVDPLRRVYRTHMSARANASIWPLLGLLIATSGACAEQHAGNSGDPDRSAAESPAGTDAWQTNPAAMQASGTTSPGGMVAHPAFPDPEPFDPMNTGCGSPRASEGVWLAVNLANHTCSVDEDCFVTTATVSCSTECAHGSLNVSERGNVERLISMVEDKYCKPYRRANCPVLAPAECSSNDRLPRCQDHYCSYAVQGCKAGCMPDAPGGTCRGAAHCDGCPAVIPEADGQPCSKPGQSCTLDSWCSPTARCSDEKEPGVFRWVVSFLLC